jgi:Flp pilus assembly protein TadG
MTPKTRIRHLARTWHDESGQVIVLMTAAMIAMIGLVGIVLDVGIQLEQRRQLQNAVDAAAHAGAQMLPDVDAAADKANEYFYANEPTGGAATLNITFPTVDHERIEIEGSLEVDYAFLTVFGKTSETVSARAVAGAQTTDIVLALDRSGSMCADSHGLMMNCPAPPPDHEPMTSVKNAANGFSDLFEPGWARVGLVSFATNASLDQSVSTNFGPGSTLEDTINDLYPSGRTNIGDAIHDSINELLYGPDTRDDALKVIVLLSDGVPNRCADGASCTDEAAANYALAKAQEAAAHGISIYTVGLGDDLDEDLMQDVADAAGGAYVASPTAGDLQDAFDTIAGLITVRILE